MPSSQGGFSCGLAYSPRYRPTPRRGLQRQRQNGPKPLVEKAIKGHRGAERVAKVKASASVKGTIEIMGLTLDFKNHDRH